MRRLQFPQTKGDEATSANAAAAGREVGAHVGLVGDLGDDVFAAVRALHRLLVRSQSRFPFDRA